MKHFITLLIIAICTMTLRGQGAGASSTQEVKVISFGANPIDLAAQKYMRKDVHGNACALIKINALTPQLSCSGSVIGSVEMRNPGEFWLYVPADAKMVKIFSSSFLPKLYEYPEALQGGVTYNLVLEVPQTGTPQPTMQSYLVAKVSPANATLSIGRNVYPATNGYVKVLLRNGTYSYRVDAPGYVPQEGQAVISGETVSQTITLQSAKSRLSVKSATPGTQIFVNGEQKGTGDAVIDVLPGLFEVEGRLAGRRSYAVTVELGSGELREVVIPELSPLYGSLNIDYEPIGSAITIDGTPAGTTPRMVNNLPVGQHTVVISADGFTPATLSATVADSQTASLTGSLSAAASEESDKVTYHSFYKNGHWGIKDNNGREIVAPKYDNTEFTFSEGLAWVKTKGKYGYVDTTGREVITPRFQKASNFSEGLAIVLIDNHLAFIDKTGSEVLPLKYSTARNFSDGLAPVEQNGKWGFIDRTGTEVVPLKYDDANSFCEGLAQVCLGGKWGFIDRTGTEVVPLKYDGSKSFAEGLACVTHNGKIGYVDTKGNELIPLKYKDASDFQEGMAWVYRKGKFGFIDRTGKEVVPPKYDDATLFVEGLASVKKNDKWGFIDKTGRVVIPIQYDQVWWFENGKAKVRYFGKTYYINRDGKQVK